MVMVKVKCFVVYNKQATWKRLYSENEILNVKNCQHIQNVSEQFGRNSKMIAMSLTHSLTHILTLSLTHSVTYSFFNTHSLAHSINHSLTYSHLLTLLNSCTSPTLYNNKELLVDLRKGTLCNDWKATARS